MGTTESKQIVQTAQFRMMCEKLKKSPKNGVEELANELETATITSLRSASVLANNRILKCDLFPSGRDKSLPVQIDNAPNFRQVCDMRILLFCEPASSTETRLTRPDRRNHRRPHSGWRPPLPAAL